MKGAFELVLFARDPAFVRDAVAAGVQGVMLDWERRGKPERQAGCDTEINEDTVEDLRRVRAVTSAQVSCRLDAVGPHTPVEIEEAIAAGADELFLPLVRTPEEVAGVIERVDGRARVAILVETRDALRHLEALARFPLSRVYVGLNDLAIERGSRHLFEPLADGTLERIRAAFPQPFGFGGLTLPDRGRPIPCRLLIAEMARLECRFSFLRRSFRRDLVGRSLAREVPRLLDALAAARRRAPAAVDRDRRALVRALRAWPATPLLAARHPHLAP
jgi:hypothetical protein